MSFAGGLVEGALRQHLGAWLSRAYRPSGAGQSCGASLMYSDAQPGLCKNGPTEFCFVLLFCFVFLYLFFLLG